MIVLKKEFIESIILHSKKEYPNEACGILAGKNGAVKKVYPMANVEKSPSLFLMDAAEQLKVLKDMRALGLEMCAIYHSHVASQAYPSAHDVEMAFYPDASYVIVSLKDFENPNVRSFRIVGKNIFDEELNISAV